MHLHLDIETYSSVDLKTEGVYKYVGSLDFEILMVAYALGNDPVLCYAWEDLPDNFFTLLKDPAVIKVAHNAAFERNCFRAVGYDIPVEYWRCSAVKAAYCGLPMGLSDLTKALKLGEKGKLSTGSALIRYFCIPVKATKTNGERNRNLPSHNPAKWEEFKTYCVNDVEAEREAMRLMKHHVVPQAEWEAYFLDQKINDLGVRIDLQMVEEAISTDELNATELKRKLVEITGLANPNSLPQFKKWIADRTGEEVTSLAKEDAETLMSKTEDKLVREALSIRLQASKTSVKKYAAMKACAGDGDRARGLFQFYGAGRTGRWAGRLIQLQNLPRNSMEDLDEARQELISDSEVFAMCYPVADTLSQLIRTALIPEKGKVFAVADFSAIEARVIAWLAQEKWRLDVFNTHGKIYEASASKMFNIPLESISYKDDKGETVKGPNYDARAKGKVAELALGYQGAVGALKQMGGEKMGLSEAEMSGIVDRWRKANPAITKLWKDYNTLALRAISNAGGEHTHESGVTFRKKGIDLCIELPSGRELIYHKVRMNGNKIQYEGVNSVTKQWNWLDTYGGKIVENVVQAIARDLLLHSMFQLDAKGYNIAMHVHDEVVCEVPTEIGGEELENILAIMGQGPAWSKGLPLGAEGYTCNYYKKD